MRETETSLPPLSTCRVRLLRLGAVAALMCGFAVATAQAQTVRPGAITRTGCDDGGFTLQLIYAGLATGGPWTFEGTVVQNGLTYVHYKDTFPMVPEDFSQPLTLRGGINSGGPVSPLPMVDDTPLQMRLTVFDSMGNAVSRSTANFDRCNTGAQMTSSSTVMLNQNLPPPTAVPTLGQWSLMLLGLVAAGLGARRLRRSAVGNG